MIDDKRLLATTEMRTAARTAAPGVSGDLIDFILGAALTAAPDNWNTRAQPTDGALTNEDDHA